MAEIYDFFSKRRIEPKEIAHTDGLLGGDIQRELDIPYVYQFYIDLSPDISFLPAMYEAFFYLSETQLKLVFTSDEFNEFRDELEKYGLILCEIDRFPYIEPEEID